MDYEKAYKEALKALKDFKSKNESIFKYDSFNGIRAAFPELAESEDERIRKWIYSLIENLGHPADEEAEKELEEMQPRALAWLEKQKPIEWSEKDKETLDGIIAIVEEWRDKLPREVYELYGDNGYVDWLKSLRPQPKPVDSIDGKALLHAANKSYQMGFRDGINSFKPDEWTKEDEEMLRDVYESLYAYQCDMRSREIDNNSRELLEQVEKEKKWLKSLRPQPKWKPTGEQLSALFSAIHPKEAGILLLKEIECLKSLYHDLKAL